MKNLYKNNKAFTLIELLAVLVILGVILVFAVPSVLDTMQKSKKQAFAEYIQKTINESEQASVKQMAADSSKIDQTCFIYTVEKELNASNSSEYKGWIIYNNAEDKYYITMYSSDYMIENFVYDINSKIELDKEIKNKIEDYDAAKITALKHSAETDPATVFNSLSATGEKTLAEKCAISNIGDELPPGEVEDPGMEESNRVFLLSGKEINKKIKKLADVSLNYLQEDYNIKSIELVSQPASFSDKTLISESKNNKKAYAWLDPTDSSKVLWSYEGANVESGDNIEIYVPRDMSYLFYNFKELESITGLYKLKDHPNGVTNLAYLFSGDTKLNSIDNSSTIDLNFINTTNVKSVIYAFEDCQNINYININNWYLPNVTSLLGLFSNCKSLQYIDLSSLHPSDKVTNMTKMFEQCESLQYIYGLGYFNTTNVLSFTRLFYGCYSLKVINLNGWQFKDDINMKMSEMFRNCSSLEWIVIDTSIASRLKDAEAASSNIFKGCNKLYVWINCNDHWIKCGAASLKDAVEWNYNGVKYKGRQMWILDNVASHDNLYVPPESLPRGVDNYVLTPVGYANSQAWYQPYINEKL